MTCARACWIISATNETNGSFRSLVGDFEDICFMPPLKTDVGAVEAATLTRFHSIVHIYSEIQYVSANTCILTV